MLFNLRLLPSAPPFLPAPPSLLSRFSLLSPGTRRPPANLTAARGGGRKRGGGGRRVKEVRRALFFIHLPTSFPPPVSSEHALSWSPGSWSLCSRSCGRGEKKRRVTCSMQLTERNASQEVTRRLPPHPDLSSEQVPGSFCKKAGLRKPARVEECGLEQCPSWRRSPWAPCGQAECLSQDTGCGGAGRARD